MNIEKYNLVKKGVVYTEDGVKLAVSNQEMAEFVWASHVAKLKKSPQRVNEYSILRHKTALKPYGCSRFIVVAKGKAVERMAGPKEDWVVYDTPKPPVGVDKMEDKKPTGRPKKEAITETDLSDGDI